ncbi:MAG: TRAP transporter large permease subunit [Peptococcaceae bacterium]|nr:TRAP transporter large permease subunit [Peptococcaceae bacterium]
MSVGLTTFLLFASLTVLLLSGLPLAFVMGGLAVLFNFFILGPHSLAMIPSVAYGVMDNFIFIAIPLFIFMGTVLQRSGIAEEAYDVMYKWIGGIKGGLAIGTVAVCTIFAAFTGASASATVSMGLIALPSMFKRGYDKSIAIGCISAGGTLGILIPPSVLMIVYGVFASESIGKLFAGGIIPGLILSFLFIAYIAVRSHLQPQLCPAIPPEERPAWREKFLALRGLILPILLIIMVLGTLLGGVCTPTEAAAIGSLGSLLCAAVRRSLTWTVLKESCYQSLKLSSMILWIIIGSSCFCSLYTAVGAIDFIREIVAALSVSPYLIVAGMMFCLLILGMFLDPGGIIMITTPIFVPIIKMLGFDPVWFGILFTINMEMGYLTPPFGFNLFYMKSIVPKHITMSDIIRSIVPFVIIMIIALVILIVFPDIVLWLPNQLFK